MIRNIFFRTVITFCVLIFIQCQSSVDTIKERTIECLEQSETIEFETEDGKKGSSHIVDMSCIIGSKLPFLQLENNFGEVTSTSDLLGKKSIIHFWFIDCKPCVEEIPRLNNLMQELGTKKINFLAISKDANNRLEIFLDNVPFDFNLFPNSGKLIKSEFGLMWGYPMTIITDQDNIVQKTYGALSDDDILNLKAYLN